METVDEAVKAVPRLAAIDRAAVRATFERYFSVEVMAANYEAAYARVLAGESDVRKVAKSDEAARLSPVSEIPITAPLGGTGLVSYLQQWTSLLNPDLWVRT